MSVMYREQSRPAAPPCASPAAESPSWPARYAVWLTGMAVLLPMLVGSAFNILYNIRHVQRLLTPVQMAAFEKAIPVYNGLVYPVALAAWLWMLAVLHATYSRLLRGDQPAPDALLRGRRMAINLPWYGVTLAAAGWLLCIPAFLGVLAAAPGKLNPAVFVHLPISFVISALIAITHGFFLLELLSQWLLYPVYFRDAQPSETPGALPLSLRSRGLLWEISAGVCPIVSLLLLIAAPVDKRSQGGIVSFSLAVGGVGIAFGLVTAAMVGRHVTRPVNALKRAAQEVDAGNLNVRVDMLRADEFGPLINEFNLMVAGLREKEQLQQTFGRHVGEQAAELILRRDPGLGGVEEVVTVMFVDIRNFTARCASSTPQEVVVVLNLFLTDMVDIIEQRHGGMVNKFLGDGFMAIFGAGLAGQRHADAAVAAGRDMLKRLELLNRRLESEGRQTLAIGVGIHTGPAVVGIIGSPRRTEYTVIGDTVNVASRVEGLTKAVGEALLLTTATRSALQTAWVIEELPPQAVKGQSQPVCVCRLET